MATSLASLPLTRGPAILDELLARACGVGIWPRKCIKHRLYLVLSIVFGCWFYTCRSIHLRSGIDLGRNLGGFLSAVYDSIQPHETKIWQLNRSEICRKICMRGASHWPDPQPRCQKNHVATAFGSYETCCVRFAMDVFIPCPTGCFGAGNSNRQFASTGNFELRGE